MGRQSGGVGMARQRDGSAADRLTSCGVMRGSEREGTRTEEIGAIVRCVGWGRGGGVEGSYRTRR